MSVLAVDAAGVASGCAGVNGLLGTLEGDGEAFRRRADNFASDTSGSVTTVADEFSTELCGAVTTVAQTLGNLATFLQNAVDEFARVDQAVSFEDERDLPDGVWRAA